MSDFSASALPSPAPAADELLRAVLDVSLSAINLLHPLYANEGGEIIDFALDYLNPAAQRLTGLPEQPGGTLRTHFPNAFANGLFDFYRRVFATGEAGQLELHNQPGQPATFLLVAARRHAGQLVASFLDAGEAPRTAVETALRESRAREQAARAEAERQRGELERVFEQAPVAIAVYRGPHYIIELANPTVARLWGRTQAQLIGKGLFEALPEVAGMGYEQLLDEVMATGVPYVAYAMEAHHDRNGQRETVYWDFVYVPMYEADGRIYGAMVVATEVTTQVLARQQVQQLNEELELRVTARSAEARAALFEAETQREQAALQQALLGQILGQVPAAIATLHGREHRFSFFNGPYNHLTANRVVLGKPVAEVLPEVVEQGFIALLDQVYASGQPFIGKEIAIMLEQPGAPPIQHYLDFTYQPLTDEQGQRRGILVFAVDVTAQVLVRRQADTLQTAMLGVLKRQGQERENVFQLFEQAPAAICLLREPAHRIDYLNPAYQALFPGLELRGRNLADIEVENAELVAVLDGIYEDGRPQFRGEVPVAIARPAGPPARTRYFDFTYQAYREQGRIVGVSIFGSDVTERVLSRQQRDAQQAELQRIFAQAPVAIAILRGPGLVIELANAAMETIWGRMAAQVLGQPYFEALPETTGQGFEAILAGVLDSGQPFIVTEAPVQLPQPGGAQPRQAYVNFVFQPLFDEEQRTTGLLAMGVEVTDQVLARQQVQYLNEELAAINEELQTTNEELHHTNARLTRTNADLDTFVYTASHDLKAPISNIEGLLAALHHELPADVLQTSLVPRLLDMMQGSVARFQQTIGHLTDIAELQQAEATETVDLPALVRGVRLDLAPLIEVAAATLTVAAQGCEAVRVAPNTLRSVVYNLLSNAVKYRAPGRPAQVQLRAHCVPGHLVLEVQDNGLGLSEAQQGQLFGMFRRLHTHVEGSGVGLFMVKRLVENAGGTITVQSEPGAGTTFTVSLPA